MKNRTNGIVKLSGNALGYQNNTPFEGVNIDAKQVEIYSQNIHQLYQQGINPYVIVGGSNIANGEKLLASGAMFNKRQADLLGMQATHLNVKAVCKALEEYDIPVVMVSTLGEDKDGFVPYNFEQLYELSERKEIVCVIAGGTGYSGFTTDSAATIFAHNIGMTRIIKSTDAGAIYNRDPRDDNSDIKLQRYLFITHQDVLAKELNFMDITAVAYAKQNKLDIYVTGVEDIETMERILLSQNDYFDGTGSIVTTPEKKEQLELRLRY